jgi:hypothetical protein
MQAALSRYALTLAAAVIIRFELLSVVNSVTAVMDVSYLAVRRLTVTQLLCTKKLLAVFGTARYKR